MDWFQVSVANWKEIQESDEENRRFLRSLRTGQESTQADNEKAARILKRTNYNIIDPFLKRFLIFFKKGALKSSSSESDNKKERIRLLGLLQTLYGGKLIKRFANKYNLKSEPEDFTNYEQQISDTKARLRANKLNRLGESDEENRKFLRNLAGPQELTDADREKLKRTLERHQWNFVDPLIKRINIHAKKKFLNPFSGRNTLNSPNRPSTAERIRLLNDLKNSNFIKLLIRQSKRSNIEYPAEWDRRADTALIKEKLKKLKENKLQESDEDLRRKERELKAFGGSEADEKRLSRSRERKGLEVTPKTKFVRAALRLSKIKKLQKQTPTEHYTRRNPVDPRQPARDSESIRASKLSGLLQLTASRANLIKARNLLSKENDENKKEKLRQGIQLFKSSIKSAKKGLANIRQYHEPNARPRGADGWGTYPYLDASGLRNQGRARTGFAEPDEIRELPTGSLVHGRKRKYL